MVDGEEIVTVVGEKLKFDSCWPKGKTSMICLLPGHVSQYMGAYVGKPQEYNAVTCHRIWKCVECGKILYSFGTDYTYNKVKSEDIQW